VRRGSASLKMEGKHGGREKGGMGVVVSILTGIGGVEQRRGAARDGTTRRGGGGEAWGVPPDRRTVSGRQRPERGG
jgi:hypothetical protein